MGIHVQIECLILNMIIQKLLPTTYVGKVMFLVVSVWSPVVGAEGPYPTMHRKPILRSNGTESLSSKVS